MSSLLTSLDMSLDDLIAKKKKPAGGGKPGTGDGSATRGRGRGRGRGEQSGNFPGVPLSSIVAETVCK